MTAKVSTVIAHLKYVDCVPHFLLGYKFAIDAWEFPGGKLDLGETPREGVARESVEEVGISPWQMRELGYVCHSGNTGKTWWVCHCFVSYFDGKLVDIEPRELNEDGSPKHKIWRWFPLPQFPDDTHKMVWEVVDKIHANGIIARYSRPSA